MGTRDLRNTHLQYRTQEGSPQLAPSELHRLHRCSAFNTPTEPGRASCLHPAEKEEPASLPWPLRSHASMSAWQNRHSIQIPGGVREAVPFSFFNLETQEGARVEWVLIEPIHTLMQFPQDDMGSGRTKAEAGLSGSRVSAVYVPLPLLPTSPREGCWPPWPVFSMLVLRAVGSWPCVCVR